MKQKLKALIALANKQNQEYPQYKGHFDQYILCRVRRTIRTKMGVAFMKGELTIRSKINHYTPGRGYFTTVYSFLNQIDTSIRSEDTEEVK